MTTMNKLLIALITLAALAMPTAAAIGSAANPFPHQFFGTSSSNAVANVDYESDTFTTHASLSSSQTVVGACVDASPLVQLTPLPPTIVRDNIAETGVGNGCFPFSTIYGDDTGTTQTVAVLSEEGNFAPLYLVCVDENGDGICSDGVDLVNLCWTGPSGEGAFAIDGGACTIYLDPAAANPNVFVEILAGLDVSTGGISPEGGSAHGYIYYQ